ncbi:MAG: succinylglutamate desuccinylase/aspartoacylase family protein [Thermomicrobiales bacterium]
MSHPDNASVRFPLLGALTPGTTQRHAVSLPGAALVDDQWPVTTISGVRPGPVVFINGGIHGGEYPGIETVIRLMNMLDPQALAGTVVLMPVVNLPGFRKRSMFVSPIDDVNPNRVFPGDPAGSYSEQLVYALMNEFIAHADLYIDLHGGDIVEALVPFSICRRADTDADRRAMENARIFGLPYLLTVDRPIQPTKGSMSFVAAAERGVAGFIAEAGSIGQLEEEPVQLLLNGVLRVLAHNGMVEASVPPAPEPTLLTAFEWIYSEHGGMFYPAVALNDEVREGQPLGRIGTLFGETIEEVTAPRAGRVLFITTSPSMADRGLLMGIVATD